jgi:tRNA U34 5-methylaminomethyl-2-thiouridine-forming methyltransferase MnmC
VSIFTPQPTADGSFTFYSEEFGQAFHSHHGAWEEAIYKYAVPTQVGARAGSGHVRILDVCYGLGYNSAAALAEIWRVNPDCHVEIVALELSAQVPQAAIAAGLLAAWPAPIPALLAMLATEGQVNQSHVSGRLLLGDARQTIQAAIDRGFLADAIFLDPFSPAVCPQLWTIEFMAAVASCCAPAGLLATYSCAAAVRTALLAAGLAVADMPPVGRKAPGTIASPAKELIPALSPSAQERLRTKAAVPYRDPQLQDTAAQIVQRRRVEQAESQLESTSQWKKRWQI